jgi:hypothetical protein
VGAALLAAINPFLDQLPYDTLIVNLGERSASAYLRAGFRPPEGRLEQPSSAIEDGGRPIRDRSPNLAVMGRACVVVPEDTAA